MRKLLFVLLGIMMLASCGGNKYKIKGRTDLVPDGANVYICTLEQGQNLQIVDSTSVDKGKFSFSGETDSCEVRLLLFAVDDNGTPCTCTVYLEPGTINVTYNSDGVRVGGTRVNDNLHKYYDQVDEIARTDAELQADIRKASAEGLSIESYAAEVSDLQKRYMEAVSASIYENADNAFGMEQLLDSYNMFTPEEVEGFLDALEPAFGNTYYVQELRKMVNVQKRLTIGSRFQDFQAVSYVSGNVQENSLSDYVEANKLTMLDFWANWCEPCKDELPYLKEAYGKFHSRGFEIVSVSVDRNQNDWLNGIKDNGLAWPQMYDTQNGDDCPNVLYGLKVIPSSFMFDADGTIVASNLRGDELIEFLEKYFSK